MLNQESIVALTQFVAALLTAGFFGYVYIIKRRNYLLLWTGGWVVLAVYGAGRLAMTWAGGPAWMSAASDGLLGVGALFFLSAAQRYAQEAVWLKLVLGGAVLFGLWALSFQQGWLGVRPLLGAALVFLVVSWAFWQESRKQEVFADLLLAGCFGFWAVLLVGVLLQQGIAGWACIESRQAAVIFRSLSVVPQLFAAVLMVMALYEEEKRRVERNMLALSNLNLATSSFLGGEIQKMLAQALDRVLSVVRIPSGALLLHHGDPEGPSSVVAVGLEESFCKAAIEEHLDDYVVNLVARLGGIGVFPDLGRASSWAALEREAAFRRFRELAAVQGLRTLVGISLQARERVFGVLLLGTPDARRFTPAELRLLLALGHQIGMAVENSYLMQQTARRSEELHILNEIGRALSSTLEVDSLFAKIYAEMRRLFDVNNYYIAFYDARRDEIRFELEISEGERKGKRSRPAGNHLTEYLIRTRQPLLIRDHFSERVRQMGVVPLQQTGCFCGVPLVLYDRAIGAMAVHSLQEGAFDEGHLELLRVLASEAVIAIENARLFSEERKKARQLSLLNNVTRHAIATLNPEDMLAKIVREMEVGLTYDHIGIGLLDYATKEVAIQAEAGWRREALGRRIALGEGLVGQVARSGESAIVRRVGPGTPQPVLPGSASVMALPISYAEQLLGVLYAETAQPNDFLEEEVRLLETLADLVAGALHNALAFQKAQEQAITDGLTGVKTHRFFMEALSAEWKRSTRAGRPFSVVLMDLDRFKFVNDFYGHLEGDVVLQRIGHILEQNCRRSDVVARYGGDEFVILMPETNMEQARQLAGKLRAWVASDTLLREKNVTASLGIATFPIHGSTPQELIQVADASMYISKHQGGNAVSTADHYDATHTKKWKQDVLEAYLGVTLKRLFTTGPEAFDEIYRRLQQFAQSLKEEPGAAPAATLPAAVVETLTSLALAIDAKDHYTQGHSQKVSAYAVVLAQALGFSDAEMEEIRLSGILHDIGKVGVAEPLLNKAGPLTTEEWETMKSHAALGAQLLEPLHGIERLRRNVRHHHEFFDGSGYPEGLAGEAIPIGARMVAIADAYDTITSNRTYKKARSAEEAFAELDRCAGTQFDPALVRAFVEALRQRPQPVIPASAASAAARGVSAEDSVASHPNPAPN